LEQGVKPLKWKYKAVQCLLAGMHPRTNKFEFQDHLYTLRQDHVYIASDKLFRFKNNKLDEVLCKLNSTENPRVNQREYVT